MPANNDSYVPLQRLYNSSKRVLQIIVREGDPDFASKNSDIPNDVSRLVSLFPGRTLKIEPNRIDEAQLSQYQGRISVQIGQGQSIGVNPDPNPSSYVFNGTFYLECPNPTGLPTDNQVRSMFGWVKPATVPSSSQALFGYGPTDTNLPFHHNVMVYNVEGRRDVEFWGASTYYYPPSQNFLEPDEWNLVGMSWNGTRLTMYVNNFHWSIPASELNTDAGVFRVGFAMANSPEYFIGDVKSISVWNEAKDYNFADRIREAGPVELNQLPGNLIKDEILTDCIASRTSYIVTNLSVLTPPGPASTMEAATGADYTTGNIQSKQSEYSIESLISDLDQDFLVMSKGYALSMIETSSAETISGSSSPDAFYVRSVAMESSYLDVRNKTVSPVQDIDVNHNGTLGNLTSRSLSNVPVFNLSARIKDEPEYSQLTTSDNSVLQFGVSTYNGLVSYWNLTTVGNTNLDSVSNNDLLKVAV